MLYRQQRSPFWWTDFTINGRRIRRSTRETDAELAVQFEIAAIAMETHRAETENTGSVAKQARAARRASPMTESPSIDEELIEELARSLARSDGIPDDAPVGDYARNARDVYREVVESLLSDRAKLEERVRVLEDEIVELWHSCEVQQVNGLHEYLHMSEAEYSEWAVHATPVLNRSGDIVL